MILNLFLPPPRSISGKQRSNVLILNHFYKISFHNNCFISHKNLDWRPFRGTFRKKFISVHLDIGVKRCFTLNPEGNS